MNTRKELFNLLAERGIYLPNYQLDKAEEMLRALVKTEGYFKAITLVEEFYLTSKYTDKQKGAYMVENKHRSLIELIKKKVVAKNKTTGEVLEFDSIYQAAIQLKGNKSCAGNISDAIKGRKKSAYGFVWEEK